MDSEITLPKPSGHDSFETMEARLSAKMELLIGTAMAQMLAKVDELITSKVNQAVAAQLRTLRKAGPLKDVSGRPSKFSRRIVDIEDDEDCTLAGLDAKSLLHSLLTPNLTMAGTPKVRRSAPSKSASPIIITQWNCRGLRSRTKRADLRLFLSTFEHLPAVVALQEPGKGATLTNYSTFQQDPSSCLCVHRNYTANKVDLDLQTDYSYVMVTLLPLRKQDPSIHILNVYCSPKLQNVSFADLFSRALRVAGQDPLLIVGDFNAPSRVWGYRREEKQAVSDVDNHLLHLWEALHSLVRRWRHQKHNRQLKSRIAELTQKAAEYAAQLADSNWVSRCNTAARQMSSRNTWRLFRALIDPTQTRTETQKHLQRAIHGFAGNTTQLAHMLRDQYLCTTQDTRGTAYSYAGSENAELDQPFQLHDLKAALAKMKRMVDALDLSVGEVFKALSDAGMLDNTIVVFISDNGGTPWGTHSTRSFNWPLRGSKGTVWEGGTRVPAFVWSPLLAKTRRVSEQLMHITDWLPTLYSVAGGDMHTLGELDGIDMWRPLSEGTGSPRVEMLYNIIESRFLNNSALRSGRYKLVLDGTGFMNERYARPGGVRPSDDLDTLLTQSTAARVLRGFYKTEELRFPKDWRKRATLKCGSPEGGQFYANSTVHLFDIIEDPCELNNVAGLHPEVVSFLKTRIGAFEATTKPLQYEPKDPAGFPENHNGTWAPWVKTSCG
ncbi:hypothetical protein HPB49_014690 [Dermacentor silvarum]|uniref:Uncharacterized protein n=1 Tax=Dermacentor silvarum TaxID=543639 RepID=A0ACB8DE42_DERSI|nr:hypothetical protein HPB49_014690 [Dermacentor silvarum]